MQCRQCGSRELTKMKPLNILQMKFNATCDDCGEWNYVKGWEGKHE